MLWGGKANLCGIELELARCDRFLVTRLSTWLVVSPPAHRRAQEVWEEVRRGAEEECLYQRCMQKDCTTPRSAGHVEREMVFLLRNVYRVNSTPPSLPHTLSLSPFYTLHLHCGSAFSLRNNNNTFTNTTVMKQALGRIL